MSGSAERRAGYGAGRSLPTGTLTFLFTDIAGSTQRWDKDRVAMQEAVRRHDALVREAIEGRGGHVFKTVGDAFCAVFERPEAAAPAALDIQRAIGAEDFGAVGGLTVRVALHTGTSDERSGDFYGPAVNRVARLLGIAHGGQILVSGVTSDLILGQLPPQANLKDLGSHRLKDLAHPEHVYQLLAPDVHRDFPPLRSLESLPNNLPLQVTSFVGRDEEIAQITQLLGQHRLVTLAGSGGVGKTRTSLQVGANLLDGSGDGVWFVELAAINDPSLLPNAIASAMQFELPSQTDPTAALVAALKHRRLLLILDNCEHLVEPAAAIVSAILRGCPSVTVLASSRQGLGISGEETFRVPSLSLPSEEELATLDAEKARDFGAIALFVERAVSADKRFALTDENARVIGEIVRRLDGIPLAIELAAPRIKLLSPPQLRQRLDERFRILTGGSRDALPRQQTLRALIDWSYDLLDERERALFRRVGIFVDGFTFEAASAVCTDATLDENDVFDVLASLVEKSLLVAEVSAEATRYRLLESTRAYALDKLAATAELDVLAGRHLDYFRALGERATEVLESTGNYALHAQLKDELENIRTALTWALTHGQIIAASTLAVGMVPVWVDLGFFHEGTERLEACLALLPESEHRLSCVVLIGLAGLNENTVRIVRSLDPSRRAIEHARALGDPSLLHRALMSYSVKARRAGQIDESAAALDEADNLENWAPTPAQRIRTVANRAILAGYQGDLETASLLGREARAGWRALGNAPNEANATLNLAEDEHQCGNTQRAIELVRETLAHREGLNLGRRAHLQVNLAGYLVSLGDVAATRSTVAEAFSVTQRVDWSSGRATMALEHLALAHALRGSLEQAALLEGYCTARFHADCYEREYTESLTHDKLMTLLRAAYSSDALDALLARGAVLSPEEAVAEGLREEPAPGP
jgi:predicted ATPase/class 3 adenylate cyclase